MKLKKLIIGQGLSATLQRKKLRNEARDDGLQYATEHFPDLSVPQAHALDAFMAGWDRCMEQLQKVPE